MELGNNEGLVTGNSQWSLASTSSEGSQDSLQELRLRVDSSSGSSKGNCLVRWYARFLVKFPYVIPVLVVMVAVTCGALSYKYHPLPDFGEDPVKGIETRGTAIRKAWSTAMSMYHNLETGDMITATPNLTLALRAAGVSDPASLTWLRKGFQGKRRKREAEQERRHVRQSRAANQMSVKETRCSERKIDPSTNVKFAYESSADLFSFKALSDICQLEATYLAPVVKELCPMMSLPYYVALINGKGHCEDLTESDVSRAAELLDKCAPFYLNGTLQSHTPSAGLPKECTRGNFVYTIFHFLTDDHFYRKEEPARRNKLRYCVSYWKREALGDYESTSFYQTHLENKRIHHGHVTLTALGLKDQLDVKYALFAKYVLEDLLYFAIAGGVILFVMFIYLQSFVLILATVFNILFSFVIAYFLYFFVCGLKFYPFINLLAGLVLVAVGADDVFIFHDCWLQFKRDSKLDMEEMVVKTLNHAALAIFVTSLTTASAFFSNMISCITSIQCFAIFAGIAVLVNFLLMVTWTPSIIILCELCTKKIQKRCCPGNFLLSFNEKLHQMSKFVFGKVFPVVIEKAWFVWLFVLLAVGVVSCVIVFVTPRLKLPTNADFQVFPSSNLLEHWDLVVATKIAAIKQEAMLASEEIPLDFLWGFKAQDKGDKLNPDDEPRTVTLDKSFDFYSEESQLWLNSFCHNVVNASFVDPRYTKYSVCTFDMYSILLKDYCSVDAFKTGHHATIHNTCCGQYSVPYNETQLRQCFPVIAYLYRSHMMVYFGQSRYHRTDSTTDLQRRKLLGIPIFDSSNEVVGINFHLKANYTMSLSYSTTKKRYNTIDKWLTTKKQQGPKALEGGFFSAETKFGFYDLQDAIATGTYYSIGLSLGVAFMVMLLTSRNLLVCLYAIFTITLAIASTVASIVLLGWSLNIIESITVSLAVGLSIDFTIHYGVAYRLSSEYEAKSRVNEAFERVGGAVAMAALTTFIAGASVMPSRVLPYIKLGIFLMLCMTFSWIYSTFFFQSLCRVVGPRGNFCQMPVGCKKKSSHRLYVINSNHRTSLASLESLDSGMVTF